MTALRTQYVNLTSHADNADGTLTVTAIARRSGIMKYRSDSGDRFEFVPPDLFDALDSEGKPAIGRMAGLPVTNEHPPQLIRYDAGKRKAFEVGTSRNTLHVYNDSDGERVVEIKFDVSDPATIEDIRSGRKRGISMGYTCKVVREDGEYKGVPYTHRQSEPIEYDHKAVVANPRNPGALITRFDSEDIAVMAVEDARSPFEVIRVDACCAACDGQGKPGCSDDIEPDEPKTKKKKAKTDAEDLLMIPVTFQNSTISVQESALQSMIDDGLIQPIRFDGRDFYVSMDVAIDMRNDGIIGGACGPGWEGTRGNCKRKKRNLGSIARNVGGAVLVGGAAAYLGSKIAKNPKKAAVIGAAALGAGMLVRRNVKRAMKGWDQDMQNSRAAKARKISLDPPSQISQNDRAAKVKSLAAGTSSKNSSTYISSGASGKGAGSKSGSVVIPQGVSVKEGRARSKNRKSTGNPGISKYPWRAK